FAGCSGGFRWPGDCGNGPGSLLGRLLENQVSLGNDSDHGAVTIDDRNAPDFVFLHCAFAVLQIFTVAAGYGVGADEFFNRRALRIQAAGNDRATEIAVGDDADELARLLIDDYGNRANVIFA